jgi:DNA-binding transcriptional LysR family regulator
MKSCYFSIYFQYYIGSISLCYKKYLLMIENLSITHLKTFLWISSLGSFRKTAEKMNTTQPAISSRIAKLEDILGARLFERDTGKIKITPAGEALRPHAEHMIRIAESLVDQLKGISETEGTVSIGLTDLEIRQYFFVLMEEFSHNAPKLQLDITVDDPVDLRNALFRGAIDMAILPYKVNESHFKNVLLKEYDYIWVTAASTQISADKIISFKDIISSYPLIIEGPHSRIGMEISGYLKVNPAPRSKIITCHALTTIIDMLSRDKAVAVLPKIFVEDELAKGTLKAFTCDWAPSSLSSYAVFNDDFNSNTIEQIVKFIQSKT